MDSHQRGILISKALTVRQHATMVDGPALETLIWQTSDDIRLLEELIDPLGHSRDGTFDCDDESLLVISKAAICLQHIYVAINMLKNRKALLTCCWEGVTAVSTEVIAVADAVRGIPKSSRDGSNGSSSLPRSF